MGVYKTRDGYIVVAMMPLGKVAELVGIDGFEGSDSRNMLENRDEVKRKLEPGFTRKTTAELMEIFLEADIWAAPVNTFPDMESDPQVRHNQIVATFDHPKVKQFRTIGPPIRFSRSPSSVKRPPLLGEHSREILKEIGYADSDIEQLFSRRSNRRKCRVSRKLCAELPGNMIAGWRPCWLLRNDFCERHSGLTIEWEARSLQEFGEGTVQALADNYDLVIIDHPYMGQVAQEQCFLPLDEHFTPVQLRELERDSVGASYRSYYFEGHQWALPVDAAAQVAGYRADLLEANGFKVPQTWEEVLKPRQIPARFCESRLIAIGLAHVLLHNLR